jgi:hypothetical protein
MKLLVCGGRHYGDRARIANVLEKIIGNESILIHGGAQGADSLCGAWAESQGINVAVVRAYWSTHGKSAGHLRNTAMLMLQPDFCVAFPGGPGTANMVRQCREAGVPVMEVKP